MFLLDDLLMLPLHGLVALCRELQDQADAEQEADKVSARDQLIDLYMQLETGQLSQAEFDQAEERLMALVQEVTPVDAALPRATRPRRARRPAARQPVAMEADQK